MNSSSIARKEATHVIWLAHALAHVFSTERRLLSKMPGSHLSIGISFATSWDVSIVVYLEHSNCFRRSRGAFAVKAGRSRHWSASANVAKTRGRPRNAEVACGYVLSPGKLPLVHTITVMIMPEKGSLARYPPTVPSVCGGGPNYIPTDIPFSGFLLALPFIPFVLRQPFMWLWTAGWYLGSTCAQ